MLAGTEVPIMEESSETLWIKWVEDTWMKDVNIFLNTIKAGVKIFGQWQPRIQRKYDSFIMEHISEGFKEKEAKHINRCRMYMRAIAVSDITTPDGKEIDRGALRGIRNVSFESVYNWSK